MAIFVVIGLGCAALAAFTSHKLYVMAELRGDIAGIPERELVVEGAVRRYQDGTSVYSLRNPDLQGQPWEIQVQFDDIGSYHKDALVHVRCDESSRDCYTRESVYVSDGNRSFDLGLLAVECLGLASVVVLAGRQWLAWRAQVRAMSPAPRKPA